MLPDTPLPNRRSDSSLRAAIERIHRQIHQFESREQLFAMLAPELLKLTGSEVFFLLERQISDSGTLILATSHEQWRDVHRESQFLYPLEGMADDVKSLHTTLSQHQVTVLNESNLRCLNRHRHPDRKLRSVLMIPLLNEDSELIGLCLGNANAAYHADMARRLWPMIASCVGVMRILDNKALRSMAEKRMLVGIDTWRTNYCEIENSLPIGIITLDRKYNIVRSNPAAQAMFGLGDKTVKGQPVKFLIPEKYEGRYQFGSLQIGQATQTPDQRIRVQGLKADGSTIALEVTARFVREYDQPRVVLMIRDSSDLVSARAGYQAELHRFRTLADLAPMGILQTDRQWHTLYVNARWLDIAGCKEHDLNKLGWTRLFHEEDADHALQSMHLSLTNGREFSLDCRLRRPDGSVCWGQLQARPLQDASGNNNGFLATLHDNTYYHEAEAKLRQLAERDGLTDLANRILFQDRLEHALERVRRHGPLALLALDLDGFKDVNDTLGHDAGDQLLIDVAGRLKTCVRTEDTVARVGGDEFMILLEGLNEAERASEIANKILNLLQQPFQISHQEVFISTSIGICFALPQQDNSPKSLLKQADMALYRAKDSGRNNFQYYSPELEESSRNKLQMTNSLHRALSRMEFALYYQPQARVKDGTISGFEALLRWQHPELGMLAPDQFITQLEETGLISSVSRWIFHTAFHQHKTWLDCGLVATDAVMSVNISPRQFHDPQLLSSIMNAAHDANLSPRNIVLEITETALLQHSEQTLTRIQQLRAEGFGIALDDFGTGYSSLSHLKHYPIDVIKIDRSFVKDILDDSGDAAIVSAVLALADALSLKVVAEGVETKEILAQLAQWDCEYFQGYLLNRPLDSDTLEQQLKDAGLAHYDSASQHAG